MGGNGSGSLVSRSRSAIRASRAPPWTCSRPGGSKRPRACNVSSSEIEFRFAAAISAGLLGVGENCRTRRMPPRPSDAFSNCSAKLSPALPTTSAKEGTASARTWAKEGLSWVCSAGRAFSRPGFKIDGVPNAGARTLTDSARLGKVLRLRSTP
jgi:hypothetical protein